MVDTDGKDIRLWESYDGEEEERGGKGTGCRQSRVLPCAAAGGRQERVGGTVGGVLTKSLNLSVQNFHIVLSRSLVEA